MGDKSLDINQKNSIMVSRNSPIALVVGVGGFLGSHLSDTLLGKGIQVVGVDDFSSGKKTNLDKSTKNKNFHLINASISEGINIRLPRLDYAFLATDSFYKENPNSKGLHVFLNFIKENIENTSKLSAEKPKVILISTIKLYKNKLNEEEKNLKEGEIKFARFVKYYKINARIVRLASLFGPRMQFREEDPIVRIIQAELLGKLQEEQTSLEFTTRGLYIADAVNLLIKSVFLGGTSQKIYDGVSTAPVKVAEIKQILLDPVWHEMKKFRPSELPPWPTPNLEKTITELGWKPKVNIIEALKETVSYFKDNDIEVPELSDYKNDQYLKRWSFKNPLLITDDDGSVENREVEVKNNKKKKQLKNIKFSFFVGVALIILGLLLPLAQIGIGIISIGVHLKATSQEIEKGSFDKALQELTYAKKSFSSTKEILNILNIFKNIEIVGAQIERVDQIEKLVEEGMDGINHTILGTQALFKTTKIISGEVNTDPMPLYQSAQLELTDASIKISKIKSKLSDQEFNNSLPAPLKEQVNNVSRKLNLYFGLIEKARAASFLMPTITAVNSKKTYLVLLQNNLELRNGGGFIGSYGKLSFENGRIKDIFVDDIYNLDGQLRDIITPPQEIKNDLGQNRLYLRDSNFEPDFPTSARKAEFLYKKEAGETINGVIALDLSGSGKLLKAVGGLDLPEYGEHVDGYNLFERVITRAEVNFFPGSQAKKNYLTSLEFQLFNKIFYLSKQNWPEIIKAVGESLEQKHLMVYLADPLLFSYLASEDWAGIMPRGTDNTTGQFNDFLATTEANYGANKSNYYLTRNYKLNTIFGKEGQVSNKLVINYRNNSPSEVFPAGKYKNRFKIYLPIGSKITQALWGESDILPLLSGFSDYGRAGYSVLLELKPKEQKSLILEYFEPKQLQFQESPTDSGKTAIYRLDVIKQAGTDKDQFDWNVTYPINYQLNKKVLDAKEANQELNIYTDLQKSRSFVLEFKPK